MLTVKQVFNKLLSKDYLPNFSKLKSYMKLVRLIASALRNKCKRKNTEQYFTVHGQETTGLQTSCKST